MFERWDKMAKAFTRIGKDIAIAVKSGGPSPDSNPTLRRVLQNARAANMPKDKIENAIKKRVGAGRGELRHRHVRGLRAARHRRDGRDRHRQRRAHRRQRALGTSRRTAATWAPTGSVAFLFKRMGVFRLRPRGWPARTSRRWSWTSSTTAWKRWARARTRRASRRRSSAAPSPTSASCRRPSKRAASPSSPPSPSTSPQNLVDAHEDKAKEVLELVDALEQDEDASAVFWTADPDEAARCFIPEQGLKMCIAVPRRLGVPVTALEWWLARQRRRAWDPVSVRAQLSLSLTLSPRSGERGSDQTTSSRWSCRS